jgi:hypothetical protein
MCDFCKSKDPGQYKFGYKSRFYDGIVAVNLCKACADKVKAAGSVEKYLEEERHGSEKRI